MKRAFQESSELDHSLNMANCLMFLSHGRGFNAVNGVNTMAAGRAFECKTCNRQFPSFQALGGHRASHKKPRFTDGNGGVDMQQLPIKPKTHECSVCGLEFAIGQALGVGEIQLPRPYFKYLNKSQNPNSVHLSRQIMKRTFQELDHSLNMANCLMFMSQGGHFDAVNSVDMTAAGRVFECKTCNRQFPSFQALGGHRASHKKPRLTDGTGGGADTQQSPAKPRTHECSVCGLEFAIGQALGGHMRRHRAVALHGNEKVSTLTLSNTAPLVKKANSRRVLCLDLNLTPYENDLECHRLGSNKAAAPIVDCFL
ncbi:hypothetical protein WN944_018287 [Citrus x changshan-huyou]|uniref:C2H2-type domain-containing protein n=1 Tax=Citrus x changshan-huyou TaxID=2935761 RepID=A0AAP0LTT2_9ROSI